MEEKRVYTKRLAYELRRMGHKIIAVVPNLKKPQFDVYIFRNTERFQKDFAVALERAEQPRTSSFDKE